LLQASQEGVTTRLKQFLGRLDLELLVQPSPSEGQKRREKELSPCFLCSWNRKHALFKAARKLEATVIALGHHSDDVAVTGLMNLFYQGRFGSILPIQHYFNKSYRLIRPLYFVSERALTKLARQESFPVSTSCCVHADNSSRVLAERWLNTILQDRPTGKRYLLGALHRHAADLVAAGAPFPRKRPRPAKSHTQRPSKEQQTTTSQTTD
jgi:tRNA(Ile)-lysidine synthase TilS/MesJ